LNLSNFFTMRITLEALQILDAIDTRGSYAAAADALNRVPSALSHAMQKLEGDLAVTLFIRAGRRAVLTPAGRTLLEDGRRLLRAAGDLECRVKRLDSGWENELRIAVEAVVPLPRLLPLLDDFYRQTSGTRLRLATEVLGGCWDALLTRHADLAIAAPGDVPGGGGFRTRPFGTLEFRFAVAPHHPLAAAAEPITAGLLLQHRAVALADTSRELLARSSGLLSGQDVLTVPDIDTKVAAQAAGLGVGHLDRRRAEHEAAAGRLVIKQVAEPAPALPLHLAWRSDQQGKALDWFLERLEDAAVRAALLETSG
jgi:DNA-binding transcriptional LysR family regulator